MADNPVEHSRTKHIDIRHHFLRDHQQKGDIEVFHISTENQLADVTPQVLVSCYVARFVLISDAQ
jgi:hypothetical protein